MHTIILAWAVQAYTALGLVSGLMALRAAVIGEIRGAFIWLAISVLIDGTDGPLARRVGSSKILPRFDGRKLDDIVDYFNYVIIPVLLLARMTALPHPAWLWASLPLLASAYGFCRADAKTEDGFFLGFPSYWNIVALYLYVLKLPRSVNLFIVIVLSVLVFIPIRYIDPFKTRPLRPLTVPLTIAWGMAVLALLLTIENPDPPLTRASLLYCAYYFLASFFIHFSAVRSSRAHQ